MAYIKPEHEWLAHVQPTGLVVSTLVLDELSLIPPVQDALATAHIAELLDEDDGPLLPDAWALLHGVLGWPAAMVAGLPNSDAVPVELCYSLADHETLLEPTYALKGAGGDGWQLLVRVEQHGIDPDARGALPGWEATPHQRLERLLRETGVGTGLLITNRSVGDVEQAELRLITAPRGETSGWISWPLRSLTSVAGRQMLGGLKLLLGSFTLFNAPENARLPALLKASRERQAEVSTKLAGQVLAALYELLRGFDAAEGPLVREIAAHNQHHLYEGLLTVLLRLVFILYAEDRDLMPSRTENGGRALYDQGYALRGLFAKLENDAALNPDTMDERRGAWGQLLALFRLIDRGHPSGFMQARGGKLFDEAVFPFLMGKREASEPDRVPHISDGCIYRILQSLMIVDAERLSYRTLDVEQIGSVYQTVMGFTAQFAQGRSIAIKAGKNNKTPVYVDCDALLATPAKDREKAIKDSTGRGQLPAGVTRDLKVADSVAALEAALGQIADERGSPNGHAVATGTPILQPTDERRRTGSHYTPRSLTEPIVRNALEPALDRLGEEATPEEVLSLKVCDPACGSGAFLVEATRQIGTRLVQAWEHHHELKPPIPADEDDDLHARRLVAQRCIYGVDRNPMATDLAKLSLWLATLARDHEFSFLDHALKSGDSLVGLTRRQIEGASWLAEPQQRLTSYRVAQDVQAALTQREAIRNAPDDVALAMQETRHAHVERGLENVRLIGNAAISSFFIHDKDRARKAAVDEVADRAASANWEWLRQRRALLEVGDHAVIPFHWEIEFPEVFARENPGFDAIIGNPPFLGVTPLGAIRGGVYAAWLRESITATQGKTDLAAYFFRKMFGLIRSPGSLGFVATKTIAQGDTRKSGLSWIVSHGGSIAQVIKRYRWPGEADVTVSLLHIDKDFVRSAILDGRPVERVSSYLWEGDYEGEPARLLENEGLGYLGAKIEAMPFSLHIDEASALLTDPAVVSEGGIKWVVGADQVFNRPSPTPDRAAFDFRDLTFSEAQVSKPKTIELFLEKAGSINDDAAIKWSHPAKELFRRLRHSKSYFAISSGGAMHHAICQLPIDLVPSHKLVAFTQAGSAFFAVIQSSIHEFWAACFSTTFGGGDANTYNPTQVLQTFPLPPSFDSTPALENAGEAYHAHRAATMIATDKGMTKTYNRFHDPHDRAADILELRRLHAAMDDAVLRAYGWDDLATRAAGEDAPRFLTEDDEDDHKYQKRLFWPAPFRDELLARLLKLNEERAAAEKAG